MFLSATRYALRSRKMTGIAENEMQKHHNVIHYFAKQDGKSEITVVLRTLFATLLNSSSNRDNNS